MSGSGGISSDLGGGLYLASIALAAMVLLAAGYGLGTFGRDHFAAICADHGRDWYQDLGGDAVTEIQDQDLFYHNIGSTIDNLKKADVVIVGSSIVAFALDGDIARHELTEKNGLKFFNMSFVGISSGEFTKRIVQKYNIKPKLLIINADDGGGGGNFFGTTLQRSFSADVKTISATEHSRLFAWREVARRNLAWRLQWFFRSVLGSGALANPERTPIPAFFRSAASGDYDMRGFPRYDDQHNAPAVITRDPNCHTTPEVIRIARDFVQTVGGEVVLTVIPNTHYCALQAKEIADALGVELVLPGSLKYSSWDSGGHYDRRGAADFTRDFTAALESSRTFKRVVGGAGRSGSD